MPAQVHLVAVKCGRCGVVFTTAHAPKLDHFSIYRIPCPHCAWPGRYLASELRRPPAGAKPHPANIK